MTWSAPSTLGAQRAIGSSRSTAPSSSRRSAAAATNVFEMLAIENAVEFVTGRWCLVSDVPALPDQVEPSANTIAAAMPGGWPSRIVSERAAFRVLPRFCLAADSARVLLSPGLVEQLATTSVVIVTAEKNLDVCDTRRGIKEAANACRIRSLGRVVLSFIRRSRRGMARAWR